MKPLSLGKIHCLQHLTNELGIFTMIAFDHRDDFAAVLGKGLGVARIDWELVVAEKIRFAQALAPHASAVLLDPIYSAGPVITSGVLPDGTGFGVALEESGYGGDSTERTTMLMADWSVAAIKRLGGAAVKLVVYYHPDSPQAKEQEAIVSQIAAECEIHEIPLILEPICYSIDPDQAKTDPAFAVLRPELVLEAARRLVPLGVDILKTEFPTDAHHETNTVKMYEYCQQLTDIVEGIPWVLLSAGVNFPTFQLQIEIACDAGASGFVAGRSIWKEALEIADVSARDRFLNTIAVSRARVLADTANYRAIPWMKRVADRIPHLEEGWHAKYN